MGKKAESRRGHNRRQKQKQQAALQLQLQWQGRLHRVVRAGKGVFQFATAHWRRIAVVLVLVNLGILGVWLSRQISLPVREAPVSSPTLVVPSPTEIPPIKTPVAEAAPTSAEISPTREVASSQEIPDSVIPGGFRTPWDVVLLFNGNDEELSSTGADGCPTASRGYIESFYGGSLPLWEEMGAVSELPELPEGVILREDEPVYKLQTLAGEKGWLVPGWATLTSQIACRQTGGAEVYINSRPAEDQAVWVVIWSEAGHAAIFRVVCGNFALLKGELPAPEEVLPTPTVSPTATPTRSPTPSPSVTPSPTPTSTPVTPTSTPTPSPTATGTPIPTPTATSTPRPTSTPQPTPTGTATATSTSTPVPTPTPVPTNTPTPRPTATPQPTPEPTSTPTPVPPTPTAVPPTPTPTPTSGPRPTATPQG